jgi:CRP/FNR family cyclic AMP-dependent transcriptional regulator
MTKDDSQGSSFLRGIPAVELKRDCPSARTLAIRHRGAVYRQGDRVDDIYCVLEGQVTLARVHATGTILTTAMLGAGEFFGPALAGVKHAEDTARAKGAASIWRAPMSQLRHLLEQHPKAAWDFFAILANRQRHMERRLEGFAFKRVEARLAETFRELSGGFAARCEHGFGRHLRLSQQELADLVGASRPVVSTILNRLRDQGVLGYNREYVCVRSISDLERLIDS